MRRKTRPDQIFLVNKTTISTECLCNPFLKWDRAKSTCIAGVSVEACLPEVTSVILWLLGDVSLISPDILVEDITFFQSCTLNILQSKPGVCSWEGITKH